VELHHYLEMADILKQPIHCVSKKFTCLVCYNFDIRELLLIILGRSVTEKVFKKSEDALFSHCNYRVTASQSREHFETRLRPVCVIMHELLSEML